MLLRSIYEYSICRRSCESFKFLFFFSNIKLDPDPISVWSDFENTAQMKNLKRPISSQTHEDLQPLAPKKKRNEKIRILWQKYAYTRKYSVKYGRDLGRMEDNGKNQDEVVLSIERKLRPCNLPTLSKKCCIYRIPNNLRQINEDAYRPIVVSIGPFYHKDPKLQPMQDHKLRYLQSFLQRKNIGNNNMGYYVNFIREKQEEIRNCYAEHIDLDDNTFVEMVFTDATFIIELFLRDYEYVGHSDDRILGKARMINEVRRDLRLEENQLPFFILNDLYNLAFQNDHARISFVSLTYFFSSKLSQLQYDIPDKLKTVEIKHFVDLLRICHLPCTPTTQQQQQRQQQHPSDPIDDQRKYPNVTKLREAGVTFKARSRTSDDKEQGLLHVTFTKGILEIPKIRLEDDTESLFRNIMVFEQCHYPQHSYIIDYIEFMDRLIDTTKDVEILIEKGIIENWLGSNEDVVNLFNDMLKQITREARLHYSHIYIDLDKYANIPWHQWRAILRHKYFNHPWAAISVIYAIVMLIVSVLPVIDKFPLK